MIKYHIIVDNHSARTAVAAFAGITAIVVSIAVGIVDPPMIRAQSSAADLSKPKARPEFEVASVKFNRNCVGDQQYEKLSPGRVSVTCIALGNLIQAAYGRFADGVSSKPKRLRLFNAPDWTGSDKYDILAKASGEAPMEQMFGPMLQSLLEDRFKLKVHYDIRELPVYAMTVAKGGLKIQPSKAGSCIPLDLNHANQPSPNFCGRLILRPDGTRRVDDAYGMSMTDIAVRLLSNRLDRPVIDRTGIPGMFDAHLEFSMDVPVSDPAEPAGAGGPSIFTAVQEQLGLKLSPANGPVEVLVIDHAEKPSEN
jgi:uncharacterized protein (TIGR03435 family)